MGNRAERKDEDSLVDRFGDRVVFFDRVQRHSTVDSSEKYDSTMHQVQCPSEQIQDCRRSFAISGGAQQPVRISR